MKLVNVVLELFKNFSRTVLKIAQKGITLIGHYRGVFFEVSKVADVNPPSISKGLQNPGSLSH